MLLLKASLLSFNVSDMQINIHLSVHVWQVSSREIGQKFVIYICDILQENINYGYIGSSQERIIATEVDLLPVTEV